MHLHKYNAYTHFFQNIFCISLKNVDILQLDRSTCYPHRFGNAKDTKILYPPLEKGLPHAGLSCNYSVPSKLYFIYDMDSQ